MDGRFIMNIEDFKVISSKLNMFQYPEGVNDENNHLKLNLSLEMLSPSGNIQKIILTYNLSSIESPVFLMWECLITLIYDEKLEKTMNKEEFFKLTDVISTIDSQVELVSKLSNLNLPLFSKTIGE